MLKKENLSCPSHKVHIYCGSHELDWIFTWHPNFWKELFLHLPSATQQNVSKYCSFISSYCAQNMHGQNFQFPLFAPQQGIKVKISDFFPLRFLTFISEFWTFSFFLVFYLFIFYCDSNHLHKSNIGRQRHVSMLKKNSKRIMFY